MHAHDDSLADWLLSLGYSDHTAARTAAQHLASPQLQPLWQLLRSRLLSSADRDKLEHALKQHSNRAVDPKLQRLQLKQQKLKQQVADCKQQICSEQVKTNGKCCSYIEACEDRKTVAGSFAQLESRGNAKSRAKAGRSCDSGL